LVLILQKIDLSHSVESAAPFSWKDKPLQLHEMVLAGAAFHNNSEKLLGDLLSGKRDNFKLGSGILYPNYYDSNLETLNLLEGLIKNFEPNVVVETGVANGKSTLRILESLQSQGLKESTLYSCDIDKNVATSDLLAFANFRFVLIKSKEDFQTLIGRLDGIDLFYHDSDHSYEHQYFEYVTVWEKLNDGGILMSDDINWSNAFLDFCKIVGRVPFVLADTEKFSGIIQK
jgi:hypothetical protein